jgi:hypothetical protein
MDDYMWYAARNLREAIKYQLGEELITKEDIKNNAPYEMSDEQMLEAVYVEHDLTDTCEPITFKEALGKMIEKGQSFPCV